MSKKYGKNEITREMLKVFDRLKNYEITSLDAIILLEPLFKAKQKKIAEYKKGGNSSQG